MKVLIIFLIDHLFYKMSVWPVKDKLTTNSPKPKDVYLLSRETKQSSKSSRLRGWTENFRHFDLKNDKND